MGFTNFHFVGNLGGWTTLKNFGNQDYIIKILCFHWIKCIAYRRICKRKTTFMSMCRKMIVFILRLCNMTNCFQLELKKRISYLFGFHFTSRNLPQYFYCSRMWHSVMKKRWNLCFPKASKFKIGILPGS